MTRVLVVDDEPDALSSLIALFQSADFQVRGAADMTTALRISREFEPDIAVVDWVLHGSDEDGLETARQLLEMTLDMRIILTTGLPLEDLRRRQREVRLQLRTLAKPFSFEELLAEIDRP